MAEVDSRSDTIKASHRGFIQELFNTEFRAIKIKTINTLPRCNNNYIHIIDFEIAIETDTALSKSPGTDPIAFGSTKAVFRIGNPEGMFNHDVKVENTVATMQLVRQALSKHHLQIIPKVYAWSKTGGPSINGWIMEEFKSGANIESEFHSSLSADMQRHVLRQVAEVLKAVQEFELPSRAANYGGLTFDEVNDDEVISGPFVIEPYTDPYSDMKSFYQGMLQAQLAEADKTFAQGWRKDGLRERLDKFAQEGLEKLLAETLTMDTRPNLIIGDIGMSIFPRATSLNQG
ncbi:hypothetical protein E4T44_02115 [Aureobasidium sp. EXF-8845]|nr:hypothetical protein E4T44_02115 [Aureobasidium sp. EXF-8845]KAI4857886.1 hypothetical protein E4T45_00606 [Aureobasidium sp. EXF-8846]